MRAGPRISRSGTAGRPWVVSRTRGEPPPTPSGAEQPRWSLRDERRKLIFDGALGRRQLYDLARDPGETRDIAAIEPLLADLYEQRLHRFLLDLKPEAGGLGAETGAETELTPEQIENLRALGYRSRLRPRSGRRRRHVASAAARGPWCEGARLRVAPAARGSIPLDAARGNGLRPMSDFDPAAAWRRDASAGDHTTVSTTDRLLCRSPMHTMRCPRRCPCERTARLPSAFWWEQHCSWPFRAVMPRERSTHRVL
jgi:hypothetical protein